MGKYKEIIDKYMQLQDMLLKYVNTADLAENEGIVAQIEIRGLYGEVLNVKLDKGRLRYAVTGEQAIHLISMSEDTFLDALTGSCDLAEELDLGHITFKGSNWLWHATKWREEFSKMRNALMSIGGK